MNDVYKLFGEQLETLRKEGRSLDEYHLWLEHTNQYPHISFFRQNAAFVAATMNRHEDGLQLALRSAELDEQEGICPLYSMTMATICAQYASSMDHFALTNLHMRYTHALRKTMDPNLLEAAPKRRHIPPSDRIRIGVFYFGFGIREGFVFPFHINRERFKVIAIMDHAQPRCKKSRIGVDEIIYIDKSNTLETVKFLRSQNIDLLLNFDPRGGLPDFDLIMELRVAPHQSLFSNFFCSTNSPSIDSLIGDTSLLKIIRRDLHTELLVPTTETNMYIFSHAPVIAEDIKPLPPRPRRLRIGLTGNGAKLSNVYYDIVAAILRRVEDATLFYRSFTSSQDLSIAE